MMITLTDRTTEAGRHVAIATMIRAAADLIKNHGYSPSADLPSDGSEGHSIASAMLAACGGVMGTADYPLDRVAGYLLLTGAVSDSRTPWGAHMIIERWEDSYPHKRLQSEAVALLAATAFGIETHVMLICRPPTR